MPSPTFFQEYRSSARRREDWKERRPSSTADAYSPLPSDEPSSSEEDGSAERAAGAAVTAAEAEGEGRTALEGGGVKRAVVWRRSAAIRGDATCVTSAGGRPRARDAAAGGAGRIVIFDFVREAALISNLAMHHAGFKPLRLKG